MVLFLFFDVSQRCLRGGRFVRASHQQQQDRIRNESTKKRKNKDETETEAASAVVVSRQIVCFSFRISYNSP